MLGSPIQETMDIEITPVVDDDEAKALA